MRNHASRSLRSIASLSGLVAGLLIGPLRAEAQQSACFADFQICEKLCLQVKGPASWARCHYRICGPQFDRCVSEAAIVSSPVTTFIVSPAVRFPHDRGGPGKPGPGPSKPPAPPGAGNDNGGIVPPHLPRGGIVPTSHGTSAPSDKK